MKTKKREVFNEAMDSVAGLVAGGLELADSARSEAFVLLKARLEKLVEDLELVDKEKFEVAIEVHDKQIDRLHEKIANLEKRVEELAGG